MSKSVLLKVVWIGAIMASFGMLMFFFALIVGNNTQPVVFNAGRRALLWTFPCLLIVGYIIFMWTIKGKPPQPLSMMGAGLAVVVMTAAYISFLNGGAFHWVTDQTGKEKVFPNDRPQVTADGKYEYELELVNHFKQNSHARLRIKDLATGEETRLRVEVTTSHIRGIGTTFQWVELQPLEAEGHYLMTTTKYFPLENPLYEKCEIDMGTKKSWKVE